MTLNLALQLMRRIRQSSKYKQRLKELLQERTQATLNGSPSKPRKASLKPRKKGCALWHPWPFPDIRAHDLWYLYMLCNLSLHPVCTSCVVTCVVKVPRG